MAGGLFGFLKESLTGASSNDEPVKKDSKEVNNNGQGAGKHYCPNCGAELEDGAKFCGRCGNPIPVSAAAEAEVSPASADTANAGTVNAGVYGTRTAGADNSGTAGIENASSYRNQSSSTSDAAPAQQVRRRQAGSRTGTSQPQSSESVRKDRKPGAYSYYKNLLENGKIVYARYIRHDGQKCVFEDTEDTEKNRHYISEAHCKNFINVYECDKWLWISEWTDAEGMTKNRFPVADESDSTALRKEAELFRKNYKEGDIIRRPILNREGYNVNVALSPNYSSRIPSSVMCLLT